ncbi:haloacid dehalogenase-like hydrolase domain-containing protein 2 [Limulus polyphemus]|uniref:Haloacid dehalogenase-like hydrolase domain-containing protein 2 n=1 Tax=Limulus polyphemus TaxID=6850 RepID=A0ABM1BIC3_LIMPO|nr:haloacid dehalogenase-like hydrolase domain-containing protein 2 [Limulus polyphemus]
MAARSGLRAVLIDLSGTLHIENTAICGAADALNRLKKTYLKIRFVTNTTKESKRILWERLTNLGFSIEQNEIFTSLTAAHELVCRKNLRPQLLLEDEALEDFQGTNTENPNAVVVGLAPSKFNFHTLNDAFRLVLSGASLIAIHKGRYYKRQDGLALGPGPFVAGLEYATDRKAEVVGKPEASFFLEGLRPFECKPSEAIMIGDDVRDDIDGAQKAGLVGMLVKTGKYREGDELKISPRPSYVFENFPAAVDFIIKHLT